MLWAHFVSPTQKCNTVIHRKIRQDAQFVKQALAKIPRGFKKTTTYHRMICAALLQDILPLLTDSLSQPCGCHVIEIRKH